MTGWTQPSEFSHRDRIRSKQVDSTYELIRVHGMRSHRYSLHHSSQFAQVTKKKKHNLLKCDLHVRNLTLCFFFFLRVDSLFSHKNVTCLCFLLDPVAAKHISSKQIVNGKTTMWLRRRSFAILVAGVEWFVWRYWLTAFTCLIDRVMVLVERGNEQHTPLYAFLSFFFLNLQCELAWRE